MAKFMQFAIVAAKEALDDANWHPQEPLEQEMTVCFQLILRLSGSTIDLYPGCLLGFRHRGL